MIRPAHHGIEVWLCVEPVDFRKQITGLATLVQDQLSKDPFRPRVWIAHASECGLDPEETIKIVRATARGMPDAVAQARDEARSGDENKAQASVDRRVTEILRYADARHRVFEQALAGMSRRSG